MLVVLIQFIKNTITGILQIRLFCDMTLKTFVTLIYPPKVLEGGISIKNISLLLLSTVILIFHRIILCLRN